MTRNQEWNKQWKSYIDGMFALAWMPNEQDSRRVQEICKELKEIVDRNTETISQTVCGKITKTEQR